MPRPVIHLRGYCLPIVTVGVGEILRIAPVDDVFGITGGPNGIFGIARPVLFGLKIRKPHEFYYLIWAFLGITILVFYRLVRPGPQLPRGPGGLPGGWPEVAPGPPGASGGWAVQPHEIPRVVGRPGKSSRGSHSPVDTGERNWV